MEKWSLLKKLILSNGKEICLNNQKGSALLMVIFNLLVLSLALSTFLKIQFLLKEEVGLLQKSALCYQEYWNNQDSLIRKMEKLNLAIKLISLGVTVFPNAKAALLAKKGFQLAQNALRLGFIQKVILSKFCKQSVRPKQIKNFPYQLKGLTYLRNKWGETILKKEPLQWTFIQKTFSRTYYFSSRAHAGRKGISLKGDMKVLPSLRVFSF